MLAGDVESTTVVLVFGGGKWELARLERMEASGGCK